MAVRRIDLYVAAILVAAAIVLHALVPRYHWAFPVAGHALKIDRWTGQTQAYRLKTGTVSEWVAQ